MTLIDRDRGVTSLQESTVTVVHFCEQFSRCHSVDWPTACGRHLLNLTGLQAQQRSHLHGSRWIRSSTPEKIAPWLKVQGGNGNEILGGMVI
ncbi:hypothetical protein K443DRAFT_385679 [Laccaria amethystina LaAM-08-1]|uniref:Uncharacterized protein n=1 Tax=Laccaria amethystina LaAM-08-1 TaxID=1095629 RepID=A0A0C9XAY3_9AGAR|nr:hypothetical protein K443DRAFT_385679 [Laccaria amethystina LaAM-08-1]